MVLLGDEAQGDARFGLFGDSATSRKIGERFGPNVPQAQKLFWRQLIELLGDVGHVQSHFGPFGDSVSFDTR